MCSTSLNPVHFIRLHLTAQMLLLLLTGITPDGRSQAALTQPLGCTWADCCGGHAQCVDGLAYGKEAFISTLLHACIQVTPVR